MQERGAKMCKSARDFLQESSIIGKVKKHKTRQRPRKDGGDGFPDQDVRCLWRRV
jgi:hypothetical protein